MLKRKLPSCACISVLNKISVPTTLGTVVMLLTKVPEIVKTANEIKKSIPSLMNLAADLDQQVNQPASKGGD